MEFDGLFEDHDLCVLANKGALGLEYIRLGRHLGEDGEFRPDMRSMIEGGRQLCALLLRSLRIHKLAVISYDQMKDYERAGRFLEAGQRATKFDSLLWQQKAKGLKAHIKRLLDGQSLNEEEVGFLQGFLLMTSDILLESIHPQQQAFIEARGIHYL